MRKLFGRLLILGAAAGGAYFLANRLRGGAASQAVAQVTYDDGSTQAFASNTPEGEELADIARKLVEMGV